MTIPTIRTTFDIGSGSTKTQTSLQANNKIIKTLHAREKPISFGADYLKSGERKMLSEERIQEGLDLLFEMKSEALLASLQYNAEHPDPSGPLYQ